MKHPGIFFFPLSEPTPVDVSGLEQGVLARRIPDFLCICLNDRGRDNASLLEIRAADENGELTGDWASLPDLSPPGEAMSFLPDDGVQAAVVGTLKRMQPLYPETVEAGAPHENREVGPLAEGNDLEIDLTLIREREGLPAKSFPWLLRLDDPGASCVQLARKIAQEFSLPLSPLTWQRLGTKNASAFLNFLRGLDGAACLDPYLPTSDEPTRLLSPFLDALELDPDFGLALRRLYVAIQDGVSSHVMPLESGLELLDKAYATFPSDKEAAAAIGEYLTVIDEQDRAGDWLRLAIDQPEPPANALETLGIVLANRGETVQARNLWLTGVRVDGHPDFFAHLARLAFTENDYDEAWDKVLRGLRRISERSLHPGEWDDEEHRGGVMLRYLSEHLEEHSLSPPDDVRELLLDLCAQIREPSDRLDLGLCLAHLGEDEPATTALRASIPHVEDPDRRDVAAQHLAYLLIQGFEEKLEQAANVEQPGAAADTALAFLSHVLDEVPQFWPACYFSGRIHEVRGEFAQALDAYRKAVAQRRDQPVLYSRIALCAQKLGQFDEARAALGEALELEPTDAGLRADLALLLHGAGRREEAMKELEAAETLDPKHEVVVKARQILGGGETAS